MLQCSMFLILHFCLSAHHRKMLYKLSEDMTEENLGVVKFLLSEEIPKSKLATSSVSVKNAKEYMTY